MKKKGGLAVIAIGHIVPTCLQAAKELTKEGHTITLLNARWIKPLPEKDIKEIFESYDKILIVEEHALAGGFASSVLEYAVDAHLLTGQKVMRHGLPDHFVPHGKAESIRELLNLDANGIKKMMLATLAL